MEIIIRNSSQDFKKRLSLYWDAPLILLVGFLVLFGLVMVYSSSFIYAQEKMGNGFALIQKQTLFAVIGTAFLVIISFVPHRKWKTWAYPTLLFATFLLVAILIPGAGEKIGGARRWLKLGPLRFQPGEFAKFAVIFFVARQLSKKQKKVESFSVGVLSPFVAPLPAMVLLLLQPDFGTTVIISLVTLLLMYLGGVPLRYLLTVIGCSIGAGLALILSTPYRRARLMTFLDPWKDPSGKGFQILQSYLGFHQGHFFGVGLGNGKEKPFFLPEAHNDFIFSVIGEELGFLGISAVIVSYLYLIRRGLQIARRAHEKEDDLFGMFLASGITLALGLQGLIHMLVVLGLVPTKGLTLPFISYGGSALVVDLFAVGVLLSVARSQKVLR